MISRLNLRVAKMEAKKGENIGKLDGDNNIKMRFKFSIESKIAAIKGINVI